MPLIEARQLTKRFRLPVKSPGLAGAVKHLLRPHHEEKVAVDRINLSIEAGESVGYVGPNGAGKSTTVKMLTGILVPSAGEVRVIGRHKGHLFQRTFPVGKNLSDTLRLASDFVSESAKAK